MSQSLRNVLTMIVAIGSILAAFGIASGASVDSERVQLPLIMVAVSVVPLALVRR